MEKKIGILLFAAFILILWPVMAFAQEDTVHTVLVNENNTVTIELTDANGNRIGIGKPIDNISYVVLRKPEGAQVTAQTKDASDLEKAGILQMSFTCDTVGTVEVQTFIRVAETAKLYTGIQTFQVVDNIKEETIIMTIGAPQLIIDDQIIPLDSPPVISHGRTFVPLRALAEAFGINCVYEQDTQKITMTLADTIVQMTASSTAYTVNGTAYDADAAPYLAENTTMVPIRFLSDAFGLKITPTHHEDGTISSLLFKQTF